MEYIIIALWGLVTGGIIWGGSHHGSQSEASQEAPIVAERYVEPSPAVQSQSVAKSSVQTAAASQVTQEEALVQKVSVAYMRSKRAAQALADGKMAPPAGSVTKTQTQPQSQTSTRTTAVSEETTAAQNADKKALNFKKEKSVVKVEKAKAEKSKKEKKAKKSKKQEVPILDIPLADANWPDPDASTSMSESGLAQASAGVAPENSAAGTTATPVVAVTASSSSSVSESNAAPAMTNANAVGASAAAAGAQTSAVAASASETAVQSSSESKVQPTQQAKAPKRSDVRLPKLLTIDQVLCDADGRPVRHVLKRGESLSQIAQKYYGDARFWPYVFEVNRYQLSSPDKIQADMKLYLPDPNYYDIDGDKPSSVEKASLLLNKYQ